MGCAAVADFRRRDRSDRRPREAISDVDRCLRAARLPAHGSAIRVRPAVRVEAELRQPPRGRLGLPKLLDLLKEAMLLPSYIAAEREKNLRDRDQAKLARMSTQESLADPETVKWKVEAIQRAEIAAAEARKARSIADASEILGALDSETIARVRELIRRPRHPCANGCCPTSRERAARPRGIEARPVTDQEDYPDPPRVCHHRPSICHHHPPRDVSQASRKASNSEGGRDGAARAARGRVLAAREAIGVPVSVSLRVGRLCGRPGGKPERR